MEKLLYSVSESLHILAAVTWIGSMIYSEFAVMPAIKQLGAPRSQAINMIASEKFSSLTWTSVLVLIVTGLFAMSGNQEKISPVFAKPAGIVLTIKLLLVGALIVILLLQIYTFSPRVKRLINPATPKDQENALEMARINNTTKWWSRFRLTLGVLVIILSVILSELLV